MMKIQRTETGHRLGKVEIQDKPLPRACAHLLLLTGGHGLSIVDAAEELGIAKSSAYKTAERIYYKLNVNSMIQAVIEANKRGLIKHLCAALFIGLTVTPQIDASELYRRPPARYRQARRARRTRFDWAGIGRTNFNDKDCAEALHLREGWQNLINHLQPQ